jgi:hypothetical protein
MTVLLQWLSTPGNMGSWRESAFTRNGSRSMLINEIYELLVANGITHRSPGSIDTKIWGLLHSFEKVEHWLQRKGLRRYDSDSRTKRKVLKACPNYPQLASLLRRAPSTRAAISRSQREVEDAAEMTVTVEYSDNDDDADDVEVVDIDTKRTPDGGKCKVSKRIRMESRGLDHTEEGSLLEAEKNVRRELFKLELQAKRDEAICVRVKSRKELLELGVSFEEVDRLMPL